MRILQEGGLSPVEYDDVKPDPVDTDVTEAGEAARKEDVDCVIGMAAEVPWTRRKWYPSC